MSGISSSTGLISGINSAQIIDQLISVESRPKTLVQRRVVELQGQQAAFLDINSKLGALRTAALKLRLNKIFDSAKATSTNADALAATASSGATPGNYQFVVDRTVSSQQVLSRGFVDRNQSSTGLTSITLEGRVARLDSDTFLSAFNGGQGISRGKVIVTNSQGTATTVDLSRVETAQDVLDAFNNVDGLGVKASVRGGRFVLTDTAGGNQNLAVRSASGFTTAESLGIAKNASGSIQGDLVYAIGDSTSINSLNDGNGIRFNTAAGTTNPDFRINIDGTAYDIDIGNQYDSQGAITAPPVSTVAQLKQRISQQTQGKITLSTSPDGRGIVLTNSTGGGSRFSVTDLSGAAADLGIIGEDNGTGSVAGKSVLAGINSRLTSSVRGGQGLTSDELRITLRNGNGVGLSLPIGGSFSDIVSSINDQLGSSGSVKLNDLGTGLIFTDTTGGTGNLIIAGGVAAQLGLATDPAGVASSEVKGSRIGRAYVSLSTKLADLNDGKALGAGTIDVTGTNGVKSTVSISDSVQTVGDFISRFNSGASASKLRARLNDAGDGIIIENDPTNTPPGPTKIKITDTSGTVATQLYLAGEATDATTNNFINGSQRRVVSFGSTDTLDTVVTKINTARAGVSAAVVIDGSGSAPFRLKLASTLAGRNGQFQIESAGADLGLSTIAKGENARVFFGSDDPARGILVSRDSNSIDGVVTGLRLDVKAASTTPVTVNVSDDTDSIVSAITDFVSAFNTLTARVKTLTSYNPDTEKKATLQGDATAQTLRNELFSTLQGAGLGVSGQYQTLAQVGLKVNKDNTIEFDETRLRNALTNDKAAVSKLFSSFQETAPPTTIEISPGITTTNTASATSTSLGVFERIGKLADRYLDSVSGVLTAKSKAIDNDITAQNDRISKFDARLAAKRLVLETQFANLESTLAKLQRQQSSLSGLSATKSG